MSKVAKNNGTQAKPDELPFEEAIERLESIVETMESDELSLDAMISRFEEGIRLAAHCKTKLSEAELKVLQVEKLSSGELTATPIELDTVPSEA